MIVIPLYAEQPWHASQVHMLGNGIGLKIPSPITAAALAESLAAAFTKILATDSYLLKAQQISRRMRAERWTPVQKAASMIQLCRQNLGFCGSVPAEGLGFRAARLLSEQPSSSIVHSIFAAAPVIWQLHCIAPANACS